MTQFEFYTKVLSYFGAKYKHNPAVQHPELGLVEELVIPTPTTRNPKAGYFLHIREDVPFGRHELVANMRKILCAKDHTLYPQRVDGYAYRLLMESTIPF